jgi:hypothetical protein
MAVELALMAGLASVLHRRLRPPMTATLGFVLIIGRGAYAALAYATGRWLEIPAGLLTFTALLAGWPGMILALVAVPGAVRLVERQRRPT